MKRPELTPCGRFTAKGKREFIEYLSKHPEEEKSLLQEFNMTIEEYFIMKKRFSQFGKIGLMTTRTGHNRKKEV